MEPNLDDKYYLLKELESLESQSQRVLAQNLGFSLGKLNFVIRALIEKGLIKMETFAHHNNKAKYRYILTPEGILEKVRITKAFLRRKEEEYEKIVRDIEEAKSIIGDKDR